MPSIPTDLPTLKKLEALWQEVSEKPINGPRAWFKRLRLGFNYKLQLLDENALELVAPVGKVNDCSTCTDNCCVGPEAIVLLSLRDIAMLHDIGRSDLMILEKPILSPTRLAAHPALARTIRSQAWEVFPILKHENTTACSALDANGQCSIYPNWPLSCARFPYALHGDLQDIFYSQRCDSFWVTPQRGDEVMAMKAAAVDAYNWRIKDTLLLAFANDEIANLGLSGYLNLPS